MPYRRIIVNQPERWICWGGSGGDELNWTQHCFIKGGSAPRPNPSPFYIPKKAPLSHTEFGILHPSTAVDALSFKYKSITKPDSFLDFLKPWNLSVSLFLSFCKPKWPNSLPFHMPEAWKWYPFQAGPPHIGHYREYKPPPPQQHWRLS